MTPVLLCLHGWGGSKESFRELRDALRGADVDILTPDLPGFGAEPEPKEPWNVDDYAAWVEKWLCKHTEDHRQPIHLLGHSHGGRIAMKMALRGNVRIAHLYLCAAAGIRHGRHFKRIVGLTLAKSGKVLLSIPGLKHLAPLGRRILYKLVRVHDYEKASPVMRQSLILVTREDFRPYLEQIAPPTDIFWGTDDRMTPVSDAELLHENIHASRLHVYKGIRHNVHREKAKEIASIIKKWCK
jgi:pimeloyl-ACP methyl ester carboxylesterase